MTQAVKKDFNPVHFIIFCVIALSGWFIPAVAPITAEGMRLLTVFLAAIYGWTVTAEPWPSFMVLVFVPFTGLINQAGTIALSWGTDATLFMVMLMVLVAFLEATGATSFVASFLMTRKFLKGHPWRLIFMLFLVAWILASVGQIGAGMFITWGFIYKICGMLGYKPYDKFSTLMVFGVAVMGALSLSAVPWANNALVILSSYMQTSGEQINYVHYMAYSLPVGLFSIIGFLGLCKFVFKLDVSRLKDFDASQFDAKDAELTTERKIALLSLAVLILVIVIPSVLPVGNPIRTFSDSMGLSMKAALLFAVLGLIKVDGKQVFNFPQLASKGVPWNMVMMICAIYCFVGLLGNEAAGISAFLGQLFTPMFQGKSTVVLFLLIMLITIILTNFMINMVVAVIMISATVPMAAALGINPLQIVYLITVSCTIAFMLPPASAASCILFANTEWVRAKDIYKYAFPTIILIAVVALVWNLVMFAF